MKTSWWHGKQQERKPGWGRTGGGVDQRAPAASPDCRIAEALPVAGR